MSVVKRVVLILFCLMAFALAASAVALRIAFPPEKIKEILHREIQQKLGREVAVADVSMNLFTGLNVKGFALSEFPNFQAGSFLKCEKFTMRLSLFPLLSRKVEVESLLFESPKVEIVKRKDGKTFNFSDFVKVFSAPPGPAPTALKTGPQFKFEVSKIKIVNGEVEHKDQSQSNLSGALRSIQMTMHGTSFLKPFKLELATQFALKEEIRNFPVKGELQFIGFIAPLNDHIKVEKLEIFSPDLYRLNLSGNLENFADPKFDVDLKLSQLSLEEIEKRLDINIPFGGTGSFSSHLKGTLESFQWEGASLQLRGIYIESSGKLKNSGKLPEFSLHIKGSQLPWEEFKPFLPRNLSLQGKYDLEADLSGSRENLQFKTYANFKDSELEFSNQFKKPLGAPLEIRLENGNFSGDKVSVGSYEISLGNSKIRGEVLMEGLKAPQKNYSAKLNCESLTLTEASQFLPAIKNIQGGDLGLEASISGKSSSEELPKVDGKISLKNFSGVVKEVELKGGSGTLQISNTDKFQGKFIIKELNHKNFESGNISLDWNLEGVTSKLNKISGSAKLRTFGGEVKNIGSVEKMLKIIDPSMTLLDFGEIGGDFTFKDGVMQIKDFWVASDKLEIGTEGTISLPEKTCNINVLAHYSGGALAAVIPISITGPLSAPKVEKKVSVFSQTLKEKLFKKRLKSKEELALEEELKRENIAEKLEDKKLKEELKREVREQKRMAQEEKKKENEEIKLDMEKESQERKSEEKEERLEKIKAEREEKEEQRKAKEEERLEKQKEKEELKRLKEEESDE